MHSPLWQMLVSYSCAKSSMNTTCFYFFPTENRLALVKVTHGKGAQICGKIRVNECAHPRYFSLTPHRYSVQSYLDDTEEGRAEPPCYWSGRGEQ